MRANPYRQKVLYPLSDGSHVPNPWDKWLASLFTERQWVNVARPARWFERFVKLARESGCQVIHDERRHWKEGIYIRNYHKRGPHILIGGRGAEAAVCSAALHELGHHVLCRNGSESPDYLEIEEKAWKIAHELALKHRLPILANIRRRALYSYRYHSMLLTNCGSKKRTRQPALTTSDRIAGSRQTSQAWQSCKELPVGKKGRRFFKKDFKQRAARMARRSRTTERE